MIVKIKNLETSDLLDLDIYSMREDKLNPDIHLNKTTGRFELTIEVDTMCIRKDSTLCIHRNYWGASLDRSIITKSHFEIETEV